MKFYIATSLSRVTAHHIVRDTLKKCGHEISYDWTLNGSVKNAFDQYYQELTSLGGQLYEILDQGKKWSQELTLALTDGGGAIFPHTFFSKCGEQMGAVIHAILDSGADQVILLGTTHPFPHLLPARIKEFNGEDISQEPSWGILDLEFANAKAILKDEFSLNLFKSLLKIEVEHRGIKTPRLIERYPSLVNRHPETLPG